MSKSAKKKKISSGGKDGGGEKTAVNDNDLATNVDNDLTKKSPAVGPTTRSKSQQAAKRSENDPKATVDLPNLNLNSSGSDTSSDQETLEHESDSNDPNSSPYPVDYVKLPKHLKKIADQITNKITVFDGDGFTNWTNLILKWANIYGLQRFLVENCTFSKTTDVRDDALLSGFIEAHLTDRIKNELDLGDGSSADLWSALSVWYGEKDVKEKVNAYEKLRYLKYVDSIEKYNKQFLRTLKKLQKFKVTIDNDFLCWAYLDGLGDTGVRMRDKFSLEKMKIQLLISKVGQIFDAPQPTRNSDVNVTFHKPNKFNNFNKQNSHSNHRNQTNQSNQASSNYGKQNSQQNSQFNPNFNSRNGNRFNKNNKLNSVHASDQNNQQLNNNSTTQFDQHSPIQFNVKQPDICPLCNQSPMLCTHLQEQINVLVAYATDNLKDVWLFDTGSTVNIANDLKWFDHHVECTKTFMLSSGEDTLRANAVGQVTLVLLDQNRSITIDDVYYCPDAAINLLTNINMNPNVGFYGDNKMIHMWFGDEKNVFKLVQVQNKQNRLLIKVPGDTQAVNVVTRSGTSTERLKSTVVVPESNKELNQPASTEHVVFDAEIQFDNEFDSENQPDNDLQSPRPDLRERLQVGRTNKPRNKINSFIDLHRIIGHKCYETTVKAAREYGVAVVPKESFRCSICSRNNLRHFIDHRPADRNWITEPLKLLHMDVCGKFSVPGYEGSRYFITSVEDYTGFVFVKPIVEKSETYNYFLRLRAFIENWFSRTLKVLRTDQGGEFKNKFFKQHEQQTGLVHQFSSPYIHFENGKAERAHHTVFTGASKLLDDANLPERFWPEAVRCAVYLHNRIPSFNSSANLRFFGGYDDRLLIRFGSKVVYYDESVHPNTVRNQTGKFGTFLGYNLKSKDYRIWSEDSCKLINVYNVKSVE